MRPIFPGDGGRSHLDEGDTASSFAAHRRCISRLRSLFECLAEEEASLETTEFETYLSALDGSEHGER
jgi:hypothetical protein